MRSDAFIMGGLVILLFGSGCDRKPASESRPTQETSHPPPTPATQASSLFPVDAGTNAGSTQAQRLPGIYLDNGFNAYAFGDRMQETGLQLLFQSGLLEEETNGNLDSAIDRYAQALSFWEKQRSAAASAAFRLGECYRKQGKTNEAVGCYQRVLVEFSDQTNLVQFCRQSLTGLGVSPVNLSTSYKDGATADMDVESRKRQEALLLEKVRIVERQLLECQKRIEVGAAAPDAEFPLRRELLNLQFRVESLNPATVENKQRRRELLEEQVKYAQKQLESIERMIENGKATTEEKYALQRDLVELKLRQETLEAGIPEQRKMY